MSKEGSRHLESCGQFQYYASGPLAQEDSPTRTVLDVIQSFNVVFSWDWSSDRFTGKPVSTTTGLYCYCRRWYDPTIGRFISRDSKRGTLSNPQSLNQYIYFLDRPTSLTDPTGEDALGSLTSFFSNVYRTAVGIGSVAKDTAVGAIQLVSHPEAVMARIVDPQHLIWLDRESAKLATKALSLWFLQNYKSSVLPTTETIGPNPDPLEQLKNQESKDTLKTLSIDIKKTIDLIPPCLQVVAGIAIFIEAPAVAIASVGAEPEDSVVPVILFAAIPEEWLAAGVLMAEGFDRINRGVPCL